MPNPNSISDMRFITLTNGQAQRRLHAKDAASWNIVVDALVPELKPGVIIALKGPLGAGKTTLVQAIAAKLGIAKQPQSPTFALMRSYDLPKPMNGVSRLIHVDSYRIEDEKDLLPLDLDAELSDGKSALLLEWPDKAPGWIAKKPHILAELSES